MKSADLRSASFYVFLSHGVDLICVACAEFEMALRVATAHAEFKQLFSDFKELKFSHQVDVAKGLLPALFRLCCAASESRTPTSFRSILKHGGFKNRNYVVIYQRLLHFWWQQNGDDYLQVDTICEENVQFTAVLDVCEKLSKGGSVDKAKEALATIAVQLTNEEKKDGHLYMALLTINTGKSAAVKAALEALLCDDKGLIQIAVQSEKAKEVVVYAVETLHHIRFRGQIPLLLLLLN